MYDYGSEHWCKGSWHPQGYHTYQCKKCMCPLPIGVREVRPHCGVAVAVVDITLDGKQGCLVGPHPRYGELELAQVPV